MSHGMDFVDKKKLDPSQVRDNRDSRPARTHDLLSTVTSNRKTKEYNKSEIASLLKEVHKRKGKANLGALVKRKGERVDDLTSAARRKLAAKKS